MNARTGSIKNGPNFEGDKNFWTVFNRNSPGIYILAFEKRMLFLEEIVKWGCSGVAATSLSTARLGAVLSLGSICIFLVLRAELQLS